MKRFAATALLCAPLGALLCAFLYAACFSGVRFSAREIEAAQLGAGLPAGFVLGAATAAHQIEGGTFNDWTDWEQGVFADGRAHVAGGEQSGRAANSWVQWPEDVAALVSLGANGYRLSLEWSRLEPSEGVWDQAALDNYRAELTALRASGIAPMVTLYHFTLPRWFAARGGWEAPDALEVFGSYVARAAAAFGDLVDLWVTVNEPNVLAYQAYAIGAWPPGVEDLKRATRVYATLLKAHARAYRELKLVDPTAGVGVAHHVRVFQPASSSPLDQVVAGLTDAYFNEALPEALRSGRIELSAPGIMTISEAYPELERSADFLGLNFYERDFVRADLGEPSLSRQYVPPGRPRSELGWDIYPEGLYKMLLRYSAWPLYVTENGIADADDSERPYYLRAHLYAVERAVAGGAPVRGYFHWSLIDNFEWAEGFSPRFGLFGIDYGDPALARVARPSAEVFREAAARLPR